MNTTRSGTPQAPQQHERPLEPQLGAWLPVSVVALAFLVYAVSGGGELTLWPMLVLWGAILEATLHAGRADQGGPAGKLQPERARVTGRSR